MTRLAVTQGLMPSMIDRLIDPNSAGTIARRGYGIEQMVDVVRRDLEDLLNTRLSQVAVAPEFEHLRNSVYAFGLPDFTSTSAYTPEQRSSLGRIIEVTVERFEPRLRNVRAILMTEGDTEDRSVRFHIDARLRVEPSPEVGFETTLELTTGHASIVPSKG
jgi:type VI secretion system protein ImpF